MKIRELSISARAKGCLLTAGYEELEDLKDITDEELWEIRNLNAKGVAEIREKIEEYFAEEDFMDFEYSYKDEFIDFDDDYDEKFEDITIFQGDERIGVTIEFCGLKFDAGSKTITINIRIKSKSEDTYNIWIQGLYINGKLHKEYSNIGEISDYDSGYMEEIIDDNADISYEEIRTIKFLVEIDDENDNELANSKVITVSCNVCNETFSVESIEDYEYDVDIIEDGEDNLDPRDIPLDKLGFTVGTYNCLKRAGIFSVGEICKKTMEDMTHVRNLGGKRLDEVVDKLNDLGLSLSERDDSLYFMASYPENIKEILRKKEEAWAYRLFIETAIYKYDSLNSYRNQSVVFWEHEDNLNRIESISEFKDFIQLQLGKAEEFIHRIGDCINKDLKESLGASGEVGDVQKIIAVTEKLMQIYKDMIAWKLSFGDIDADYMYRKVIEQFCPMADSVLENIDVVYEKLHVDKKQYEDLLAGRITGEELNVGLKFTLEVNVDGLTKALDEWKEEYSATDDEAEGSSRL